MNAETQPTLTPKDVERLTQIISDAITMVWEHPETDPDLIFNQSDLLCKALVILGDLPRPH